LKSDNIFIDVKNKKIKISDFGISRKIDFESSKVCKSSEIMCISLSPPEYVEWREFGRRADTWALGLLLYEMCTYKHPFVSESHSKNPTKYTKEIHKSIIENEPNYKKIPYKKTVKFIKRMLEKDDKKRPLMIELAGELDEYYNTFKQE